MLVNFELYILRLVKLVMKSKEMAAYVPMVQEMADIAIEFLAERGLCFSADYQMPELSLSLEKRIKVHGIYNKHNVLAELRRLQRSFAADWASVSDKEALQAAAEFLTKLALFLEGAHTEDSGLHVWLQLKQSFEKLEVCFSVKATEPDMTIRLKLWQQLVRLFAKIQQLEIKQHLSGVFSSEGKITLYMNNIETICHERGFDMKAYLQSVLIHEYVHACHYAVFMDKKISDCGDKFSIEDAMLHWSGAYCGKKKAVAVKEGLARYVQILWCQIHEPVLAGSLRAREYGEYVIYPNWPYVGAQALLCLPLSEADELFYKLWKMSLIDWQPVYELLSQGLLRVK